jgi:bifunctional ADP-heptose synthase (sugar kinase/adenylyltransferase)
MVTEKIIDTVRHIAEMHNIPVFADTQCSTQVGSICKYRGFTVLTPNEREARLALQDQNSGVEQLAMDLIQETRCKQLVMKLGSEGFISYQKSIQGEEISRISYPALSSNPIDVAGAGDSLLAVIAIGISANAKTEDLGILASCMSAIAVERMGNSPIRRSELIERLERLLEE